MVINVRGGYIWYGGWHYVCEICDIDSSNSGTQGYKSKAAVKKALKDHIQKEHTYKVDGIPTKNVLVTHSIDSKDDGVK